MTDTTVNLLVIYPSGTREREAIYYLLGVIDKQKVLDQPLWIRELAENLMSQDQLLGYMTNYLDPQGKADVQGYINLKQYKRAALMLSDVLLTWTEVDIEGLATFKSKALIWKILNPLLAPITNLVIKNLYFGGREVTEGERQRALALMIVAGVLRLAGYEVSFIDPDDGEERVLHKFDMRG